MRIMHWFGETGMDQNRMISQKKTFQMSETTGVMIALTLSGGMQDAYSYFLRGKVFANAQTGNIVLMGAHLFNGEFAEALRYLFPIVAFAMGVFTAEQIRGRFQQEKRLHWRQLIVAIEVLLLLIVGLLPVNDTINPIANALTSFSCAMQVQAFRKVNGYAYASTMCIGNMRSGMEALSAYTRTGDRETLRKSMQYGVVILTFLLGAGAGGALIQRAADRRMIWISCALLAVCFLLMLPGVKDPKSR